MRYIAIIILTCNMVIGLALLSHADTDVLFQKFTKYFNQDGTLRADDIVDAMRNNEIDFNDKATIQFLEERTKHDLKIVRNTFFAKHGFIFESSELRDYFNHKPWYVPRMGQIVLSKNEEKMISIIREIENCENVNFTEFRKLFTSLNLPFTYSVDSAFNRKPISIAYVRKFLNPNSTDLPYYAIGEFYHNNILVLLYDIESFETQPHIATFNSAGKLIADKTFFSVGGDITSYTDGKLVIEKDLTINVKIEGSSDNNETIKTRREKYRIDLNGQIQQFK